MARHRDTLPRLDGPLFLSDSGLETTLIFRHGYELPVFASFVLLESAQGRETLDEYYRLHAAIARDAGVGFVLESLGWRASRDWGAQLGYSPEMLDRVNRESIDLLVGLRDELESPGTPMVISGCIGPRGDAYSPEKMMTAAESEWYHRAQVETYRDTDADMVSAYTMTHAGEAIGIVRAASSVDMPVVISFTVETDGTLPSGMRLDEAIDEVDTATDGAASYFMVNCAHPSHFDTTLEDGAGWVTRIGGISANSSRKSHAELDNSEDLDSGDPDEFGREYAQLLERFPHLSVLRGCCGTDERHIQEVVKTCAPAR